MTSLEAEFRDEECSQGQINASLPSGRDLLVAENVKRVEGDVDGVVCA